MSRPRTGFAGARAPGTVVRYVRGAGLLARGMSLAARNPRMLVQGMIPVVIAAAIFITAFAVLIYFIDELAASVTWFADDWTEGSRTLIRLLVGIGILGAGLLVAMVTFVQFTLQIGDPFYEKISAQIENLYGGVTGEVEVGLWWSVRRALADASRMLAITVTIGACLFVLGFLPVVGQTVVPVLGASAGGWLLAVELVGVAYSRRGRGFAERWRALRAHRPEALGFGTAVFLCFTFIPFGAVLFMPAAVAGGTLLARKTLGLPYEGAAGSR